MNRTPRRSFVLFAVLLVIAGSTLVATMLVRFAGAESAVARASADHARSQALASSGLEVLLTVLDRERGEILAGRSPSLERQYLLYESESESGVVRVLASRRDEYLTAVGGLLDLNHATSDQLVATGLIDREAADSILRHRDTLDGKRFRSLEQLLDVKRQDGSSAVLPEELLGPLDALDPGRDALGLELDRGERALEALGYMGPVTLEDVLTVHSFEPALQRNGVLRINLNVPWSEELARRMDDRFGEGTGAGLKQIMERVTFDDEGKITDVLRAFNVEPEEWVDVVDACTSDSRWHQARIDLNTAPAETLQSLPGIDESLALDIVRERDSLSAEERMTRVWPVIRGLIEPEAFSEITGKLTTRCWLWRIRLAAGTVAVEDPEGPIENPVLLDVIVDLASPVARIAMLRDISGLEVGLQLLERRYEEFDGMMMSDRILDDPDSLEDDEEASLFPDSESVFDGNSFLDDSSLFEAFESAFTDPEEDEPAEQDPGSGGSEPVRGPHGRWSPL